MGSGTVTAEVLEAAELVGMGKLAGLGLRTRTRLEAGACEGALGVGVIWSGRCPSKPVSAYERFREAGEDIGGVRTLMELDGDAVRCWLF